MDARLSSKADAQANPRIGKAQAVMGRETSGVPKVMISSCQEKPLAREKVPVPQTDTGGREENSKARGRTLVKELGKMTP